MFLQIFKFEIWYRLRRPATYIYFGILLVLSVLMALVTGGFFESISAVVGSGKVHLNSPFTINGLTNALTLLPGILLVSAMFGPAVLRDFDSQMHPLLYTAPISKWGYLGGRFFGTLVVTLLVMGGIGVGLFIGALFPGIAADRLGPFHLSYYLAPYLTFVLPNVLLTGAIFFALATLTRQALSTYVGSIVFLVLYFVAQAQLSDLDNQTVAALLDPMGNGALVLLTKYWTPVEKNVRLLWPTGLLGLNRLLWLGVGLLLFAFCYLRFRFEQGATGSAKRSRPQAAPGVVAAPVAVALPAVSQQFGFAQYFRQYLRLTWLSLRDVLRSPYFIAIVAAGLAFLLAAALQIGKIFDTSTYPVTAQVIQILSGSFSLFVLAIVTFYAGELVWKERDARLHQMHDALPIPNWVPFASKLTALLLVPVVLLFIVLVFGIGTQLVSGYTHLEIGLYLRWLFGLKLVDYWLVVVLAVVVQVVVNNKYLGHFVMVLYYVFTIFAGQMGLEHNLLIYGADSGIRYSDMNGFGHFVGPYLWFKLYWGLLAVALAVVANLLWVRGSETDWHTRRALAGRRFTGPARAALLVALLGFGAVGTWIFYNTNVLNTYRGSKARQQLTVQYEQQYGRYHRTPQPRIVAVDVQVDLFPAQQEARVRGQYWLRNKTAAALDTVILNLPEDVRIRKMQLGAGGTIAVVADSVLGFYVQRLPRPLAPGDSLALDFDLYYDAPGFEQNTQRTGIVANGTFVNNGTLPHIGYNKEAELSEESARKKFGLKPKLRMARLEDTTARANTYIAADADWVRFAATVSTVPDQLALAPGYLQKEWTANGRRYFRYTMDAPILDFYSFQSARYAEHHAKWQNVAITIYYQPGHEYNLNRMVRGVQDALSYYTKNFGPYQHRQVRIVEFPGYSAFAQAFPNTIPFSENIGFIAKVDTTDPKDVDYPYYVTAHEVAHQWWAHQVIGAAAQGSTLLSETLSQYSALMVMKQKYGAERMRKFLKYELDAYLRGRSTERVAEQPLYRVENQQYIHYRKGSVVMYALADYLGEAQVNQALSTYLNKVKFQPPPYTTSLDLLREFRQVTPDSLQYLLPDMFERITLYENKADSVTARQLPDGRYRVDMVLSAKKVYADSAGNERPAQQMNDLVDVAVLARRKINGQWQDVPLYRQKRRFRAGTTRVSLVVSGKPEKAGIDPYNLLIDRTPDDNLKTVTIEK
ncbi:ABC transporter permease/M1 family aminopeptidase [Hymenobacter rubripertinctus]|uniref:Peptidase M1 membrane alanine aminopeptidase domain-containing protein n=1 Tax=Hymenobacter rubripertinctus TaxID=2029981 RepID=A0A418R1T4_9BACT|nr:M1 family aminopeptidase [Hymenobacter rubripertinctus]RIY11338.1 hypothetical protein D0T11_07700 [Hymenobacter rubripertinctus]